jgi:hypothetical protein
VDLERHQLALVHPGGKHSPIGILQHFGEVELVVGPILGDRGVRDPVLIAGIRRVAAWACDDGWVYVGILRAIDRLGERELKIVAVSGDGLFKAGVEAAIEFARRGIEAAGQQGIADRGVPVQWRYRGVYWTRCP